MSHQDLPTEIFPYEHTWTTTNQRTGVSTSRKVRYRFVEIRAPDGWTTYPGQECHAGKDGLLIENDKWRWWEQDLWGAHCERYCLDIGCFGEPGYICDAHAPDWRGEELERREFETPEEAAAWAQRWMDTPEQAAKEAAARKASGSKSLSPDG